MVGVLWPWRGRGEGMWRAEMDGGASRVVVEVCSTGPPALPK